MRLIDADELIIMQLHDENDKPVGPRFVPAEFIEEAPTIEAIPVSFIEHQAEICEAIPAPFCARVYNQLLENWKKERAHETD